MPRLIDTHCHLNFEAFEGDFDEVAKRSLKAGVEMIIVSTDYQTSKKAIEIAGKYSGVWVAVGFHPIHVLNRDWRSEILRIAELIKHKKVVAIGEIGFDRYRMPENDMDNIIQTQQRVVDFFTAEAKQAGKPIIFHNREAMDMTIKMLPQLKNKGIRAVQHCYPGNLTQSRKLLDAGFMLSFTGMITYNNAWDLVIKKTPIEKIMIETDSPYLTPIPYRGKRNEPVNVVEVAKYIARIKNLPLEEVAKITYNNAHQFFNLE